MQDQVLFLFFRDVIHICKRTHDEAKEKHNPHNLGIGACKTPFFAKYKSEQVGTPNDQNGKRNNGNKEQNLQGLDKDRPASAMGCVITGRFLPEYLTDG